MDSLAKKNLVNWSQQVICSKGPTTELPVAERYPNREQKRLEITVNYGAGPQLTSPANYQFFCLSRLQDQVFLGSRMLL